MTKTINCSDVVETCSWSASAENEEELMKKISEHAKEHGFSDIPTELIDKVKKAIKDI